MTGFFKHRTALVESKSVGNGTRIWAFAHVMKGASIGKNCNIGDHCFVEEGAIIGNDVTIKNGVSVWNHIRIEDGVFLGPHATLTNDLVPRSKADWNASPTLIERGATIGANATILCGLRIGAHAFIGAGSTVTRNVPAHALCYGNPARIRGWVCECGTKLAFRRNKGNCSRCARKYRKSGSEIAEQSR